MVQEDHEIDDMIKEIKADLTSAEKKEIHKVVKDYSEKMRSFLRTKARIEKMKEEKVQLNRGQWLQTLPDAVRLQRNGHCDGYHE